MANQASAASSSMLSCSTSTSYIRYDAFINHRGPDVKNTFAAYLYSRLRACGFQVFLDKPELQEGHEITAQIQSAIEVASVHIAIFSPTYAESKWCLDELVLMVQSRAPILPVFYKVKPSDLRWTMNDGVYAKALRNHEQKKTYDSETGEEKPRYDFDTIQNWRSALSRAAEISGFELVGDEEELLSKVVEGVLKIVPKPPLHVAKYPTGLEEKLQEFETIVLNDHEGRMGAKVVGIVGYGGVGKTTLAKEFFNRKRSHYSESSFLFDVRETAARKSLAYLQSKLLEDLKHMKGIKIESHDEGMGILRRYLASCQALIVIDDVDNASHLDVLLPVKDILRAESLILVTTRDKHVLKRSGVPETFIYNLKGLNRLHSQQLFCSHAFNQSLPAPEFAELVNQFVKACDGLPLSLKVIGALVCGEDEPYWKGQLERLCQTLPDEIQKILRISYDSLIEQDKAIFLDIACFFLGENREKAIRIWGLVGVRNIENKCLLEVDSENKIRMHDHIRDCARSIAEEESMPRRLWQQTPNMIDDLVEKLKTVDTEVRGITARVSDSFSDVVRPTERGQFVIDRGITACVSDSFSDVVRPTEHGQFVIDRFAIQRMAFYKSSKMGHLFNNFDCSGIKNLRLLATEDVFIESILRRVRPPQLTWLRWYGCSHSSLPDWIPMKNLRVLEVAGSSLKSLWLHQCQAPLELRELNILAPLSEFPRSIGRLKHLEWITIGYCRNAFVDMSFCGVTTLPEEFCDLSSLKYLVLTGFSTLMSLPDSFGKLQNLQHINLEEVFNLKMLPDSFGYLTGLKHLSLIGAISMLSLPDSFGKLTNLQQIDLRGASSLKMLPDSFGCLTGLKHLSLMGAKSMLSLPDSFGKLTNLQHINLLGASSLKTLPDSFGNLTRLKHLCLMGNIALTISNGTLGNITTLEYLNLEGCKNVKELPRQVAHQLSLKELNLEHTNLKELPIGIGHLGNLEDLKIGYGPLEVLPPSPVWASLKVFSVNNLPKLNRLSDSFAMLTRLKKVWLFNCGIEYLPQDLPKINNLEILEVRNCPLQELPLRGRVWNILDSANDNCMVGLKMLCIAGTKISEIAFPEGVCPNLQILDIGNCHELRQIGELCGLAKLKNLDLRHCVIVEELPSLETLRHLEEIRVQGCRKLKSIQGLEQLTRLRWLEVSQCDEIVGLSGVERCTSLVCLRATYCRKLKNIAWLGQLTKLQDLNVSGCQEIVGLAGVEHCTSLRQLWVSDCPKLENIPGFGRLTKLEFLNVKGCNEIVGLPGVEHCTSLKRLDARDCPKLQWGGGVIQQLRQRLGELKIDVIQ